MEVLVAELGSVMRRTEWGRGAGAWPGVHLRGRRCE
jgi:hypothetical protein